MLTTAVTVCCEPASTVARSLWIAMQIEETAESGVMLIGGVELVVVAGGMSKASSSEYEGTSAVALAVSVRETNLANGSGICC